MDTAPHRASKMPRIDNWPLDGTIEGPSEKSTEKQQGALDAERAKKSGGEGYVPRNPDMCFHTYDLGGVSGCCVIGPTLYLFGNANNDLFSYELLPRPLFPVTTLTRGMLTNVERPMNFPKICPAGIQAPGGKMIVLSSWIVLDEDDNIGKFEMFDPKNKEWEVLPDLLPLLLDNFQERRGLPGFDYNYECTDVHSYSFINNGPVLLVATELGNFTLDTSQTTGSEWLRCNGYEYPLSDLRLMLVPDDDLALMDWRALQKQDGENPPRSLVYPGLEDSRNYFKVSRGAGITWLPPSNNRFCIARSHIGPGTLKPHLIIDVCSFDSDVFQSKKNQTGDYDVIPGVTERLKFVLGPQKEEDDSVIRFNTNGLFSMVV